MAFLAYFSGKKTALGPWLFLRLLGATYVMAFLSLAVQVAGLLGKDGVLPAQNLLNSVRAHYPTHYPSWGTERYLLLPTLFWLGHGDAALELLCYAGAALGLVLCAGVTWAPLQLLLWAFYLSIMNVGRDFLHFQWDSLLLETGFLAIFLGGLRPERGARPVAPALLWLLRWLLFRLMFSSGWVKLDSGDETWRSLSALRYHFETQPLPTFVGYYAHQIPDRVKTALTFMMFVVELGVPFLIFFPQRVRRWAFFPLAALLWGIALTGNYGFFDFLSVALCVLLLPDEWLRRVLRSRELPARPGRGIGNLVLFCFLLPLTVLQLPRVGRAAHPLRPITDRLAPFHLTSPYGLFAVMTTSRPEIVIEGSNNKKTWLAYEFRYKPGDLFHRPPFVAPHQPRLDWQMWFAALGPVERERNRWFASLCLRLLQGQPKVLALLGKNPFPTAPPRYLRATLYDYHFTALAEKRKSGAWWLRSESGPYTSVLSLQEP